MADESVHQVAGGRVVALGRLRSYRWRLCGVRRRAVADSVMSAACDETLGQQDLIADLVTALTMIVQGREGDAREFLDDLAMHDADLVTSLGTAGEVLAELAQERAAGRRS